MDFKSLPIRIGANRLVAVTDVTCNLDLHYLRVIGFFQTPKLLIETSEKVAIERELLQLGEFFGTEKWRTTELLRPEEFAAGLKPDEESVRRLFVRLADFLELNTERVRLMFSAGQVDSVSGMQWQHSHDRSRDEHGVVVQGFQSDLLVGRNIRYPSLLAEMVRMLVAEKLVFSGYEDVGSSDLELRAEVATVFFGFGLFTVNETVACCQSTHAGQHFFSLVKLGALNSFGIGYLLALVLWQRNQTELSIGKYLRPDAELSFQKSWEYLEKTNDSLLCDPHLTRVDATTSISTIDAQLQSCTPTGLLWLLERMQQRSDLPREVGLIQSTLFGLTRHRDIAVARMALHLVSFAEQLDSLEIRQLQKIARGRDPWMSAVAANILSTKLPFDKCETEFSRLLERFDHDAAANAAHMAHRFGRQAARYEATVCQRIKTALNRCHYGLGFWYMLILTQISADAEASLESVFGEDEDLIRGARDLWQEVNATQPGEWHRPEERPREIQDIFAVPAWISL